MNDIDEALNVVIEELGEIENNVVYIKELAEDMEGEEKDPDDLRHMERCLESLHDSANWAFTRGEDARRHYLEQEND